MLIVLEPTAVPEDHIEVTDQGPAVSSSNPHLQMGVKMFLLTFFFQ